MKKWKRNANFGEEMKNFRNKNISQYISIKKFNNHSEFLFNFNLEILIFILIQVRKKSQFKF